MHWITPGEPSARSQKGFTVFPRLSKIKTKQNKTNKKPQKNSGYYKAVLPWSDPRVHDEPHTTKMLARKDEKKHVAFKGWSKPYVSGLQSAFIEITTIAY